MPSKYDYLQSALKFWPFYEGPEELQELSGSGGDEEWLIYVPVDYLGTMPPSHDGWPDLSLDIEQAILRVTDTVEVEWHELEDGNWVAITSRS